jgi:hypothetical protein
MRLVIPVSFRVVAHREERCEGGVEVKRRGQFSRNDADPRLRK